MNDPVLMLPITLSEFKQLLVECSIQTVANALIKQQKAQESEEYLSAQEAADFMCIGITNIRNGTRDGKYIGYRVGARVLYKKSELEAGMIPTNQYTVLGKKRGPKPKTA